MKRFVLGLMAIAMVFSFVGVASAASTTTPVVLGNGDPMRVTQGWGLDGYNTPKVNAGAVIVDEGGISSTCPLWYSSGCFDLSRTESYRSQMRSLVSSLVSNGSINLFPIFLGWVGR